MRDTPYATELCPPGIIRLSDSDNEEGRIERILVKDSGQEEIRFSWWKNGNITPRPLDLCEDDLIKLLRDAVARGVFTDNFISQLRTL
jgi:hypothetical protein